MSGKWRPEGFYERLTEKAGALARAYPQFTEDCADAMLEALREKGAMCDEDDLSCSCEICMEISPPGTLVFMPADPEAQG